MSDTEEYMGGEEYMAAPQQPEALLNLGVLQVAIYINIILM